MTATPQETCTLCEVVPTVQFKVTGIRMFPNNIEAPYKLCNSCCEGLYPFSPYKPGDKKMREDFWQSVWDTLSNKYLPKSARPVEETEEVIA